MLYNNTQEPDVTFSTNDNGNILDRIPTTVDITKPVGEPSGPDYPLINFTDSTKCVIYCSMTILLDTTPYWLLSKADTALSDCGCYLDEMMKSLGQLETMKV